MVTLAISTGALYFLSQDLRSQVDQIVAGRASISERALMLESLADLKRTASQADVYKRAMDTVLVTQDQLIDFPRWLDSLARGRGVVFNFNFTGDPVQPHDTNAGYIGFTLIVNGTLDKIIASMEDVESKAPRFLVELDNFDLSGGGSDYRIFSNGRVFFR